MEEYQAFLEKITQGFALMQQLPRIQYEYNHRKLVYQRDKIKLYHYQPLVKRPHTIPVLVVFATVNRPEILDLFPDHSFIGGLLKQGLDVYLVDWGFPDLSDKDISLEAYINTYLHACIQHIQDQSQQQMINLVGVCQGGIICLCYALLFQHIKNLVLVSTPIDFHTRDNKITKLVKRWDIKSFAQVSGNISGAGLTQFFIYLRPFELIGKKYLRLMDNLDNPAWTERFLRVEKWLNDAPDQTGQSFFEFIKYFYQENKLIKGEIYLQNKQINLANLTIPVLNVIAGEDEIIPPSASRALKKYVGSNDYSQRIFPSGHIGIYVSDKVGDKMTKAIAQWLKKR